MNEKDVKILYIKFKEIPKHKYFLHFFRNIKIIKLELISLKNTLTSNFK
jgi:hypothetical protein